MDGIFIEVCAFIFGAIVGSFLNVVILRFNTGKGLNGRSGCFSCGKNLAWYELVPILSFVFLRGRCSSCKSAISLQYPLVELVSGGIFVYLFQMIMYPAFGTVAFWFALILFLASAVLWSSLLIIFVYDMRHKIIPDLFSALFFVCALIITGGEAYALGWGLLWTRIIAGLVLSGFFFILWFVSQGRWMGFGDVKLAFSIGLYLGLAEGLSAIAFGFWIGALFALTRLGTARLSHGHKTLTMKSEVPFAPFLILGTFLALLLGSDIFHISLFFHV